MYEHEAELITLLSVIVWILFLSFSLKGICYLTNACVEKSNRDANNKKLANYVHIAQAFRLPYHDGCSYEGFYAQTVAWVHLIESHQWLFSKTWMGSPVAVLKTKTPVEDGMITPLLYPWLTDYFDRPCMTYINDLHINPMDMAEVDGGGVFFTIFPTTFAGYVYYRNGRTTPSRSGISVDGSLKLFLAARAEAVNLLSSLGRTIARNSFNSPNKNQEFIVKRRGVREIPTPELVMEVISMAAPAPTHTQNHRACVSVNLNVKKVHQQITKKLDEELGEDWPSVFTVGHYIITQTPKYGYTIRAFSQWNRIQYALHKYWMSDVDPYLMNVEEMESLVNDVDEMKKQ